MSVPLEVNVLALRCGCLSPGVILGWKIWEQAKVFFGDLENLAIAARGNSDAARALSQLSQARRNPFPINISEGERPWDFLLADLAGRKALAVTLRGRLGILLGKTDQVAKGCSGTSPIFSQSVLNAYTDTDEADRIPDFAKGMLDDIRDEIGNHIETLIEIPLEAIAETAEILFLPLETSPEYRGSKYHCRGCRTYNPKEECLEINGEVFCIACSGLEPSWFIRH